MKKVLKRNQIVISVIAVMLIAAGYMNYTTNIKQTLDTAALTDSEKYAGLGDATLVSSSNVDEENKLEENKIEENKIEENKIEENQVQTSVKADEDQELQYFAESRLEREKMYSQMIESYQKILQNTAISEAQREIAQNEIKKINDIKNSIMIAENLIKNKGIEDVIIFINGESVNIIVKANDLSQEQIAQVQNIVTRELKVEIENIHISKK